MEAIYTAFRIAAIMPNKNHVDLGDEFRGERNQDVRSSILPHKEALLQSGRLETA